MIRDPRRTPIVNEVVLHDAGGGRWLHFSDPVALVVADDVRQVVPCLRRIERLTRQKRLYAAGCVSYEAAPAFDPAFKTHHPTSFPLLWFGVYPPPTPIALPEPPTDSDLASLQWMPSVSKQEYCSAIARIKEYIARGATYQVNYTLRQHAPCPMRPWHLFLEMASNAPYAAFLETERHCVCSASPELFFQRRGPHVTCRPMKGTAPRGRTTKEDLAISGWLRGSEKNRAENAMIVDMVRNDLGRIALPGSVRVTRLFETEKYPTIWQMTSTVVGRTEASLTEIINSLFPCASITGAPKVSTMRIIADLENRPRNVYTGCIGFVTPEHDAQFSVAIRTVLVDKSNGLAEYGVGGGIVWDSIDTDEYEECSTKTRIVRDRRETTSFSLLETMLWTPQERYFLLDHHLLRLADSASYFGYPCNTSRIRNELAELENRFEGRSYRVRLLLEKTGQFVCQHEALSCPVVQRPRRLMIAPEPVDENDPFLYHKTTNRSVYESAAAACSGGGCDDVLLWNRQGQITETCVANVVVRLNGRLVTPPIECGLLAGTYRRWLLSRGIIAEAPIALDDLSPDSEIYLVNSVRKWQTAQLVIPAETGPSLRRTAV